MNEYRVTHLFMAYGVQLHTIITYLRYRMWCVCDVINDSV